MGLCRGGAFHKSAMRPSAKRAICGQQVTDKMLVCFKPVQRRPSSEVASHKKPDSVRSSRYSEPSALSMTLPSILPAWSCFANAIIERVAALPGFTQIVRYPHHSRVAPLRNDLLTDEYNSASLHLDHRVDAAAPGIAKFHGCLPGLSIVRAATGISWQDEIGPLDARFAPVPALRGLSLDAIHPSGDDDPFPRSKEGSLLANRKSRWVLKEWRWGPCPSFVIAAEGFLLVDAQHSAIHRGHEWPLMFVLKRDGFRMESGRVRRYGRCQR